MNLLQLYMQVAALDISLISDWHSRYYGRNKRLVAGLKEKFRHLGKNALVPELWESVSTWALTEESSKPFS